MVNRPCRSRASIAPPVRHTLTPLYSATTQRIARIKSTACNPCVELAAAFDSRWTRSGHLTAGTSELAPWLICATDGYAKNFSLFLRSGGRYTLTPLYDVMSAQPNLDARQIEHKHMKLAMSVGKRHHYRVGEIQPRHFLQAGSEANIPPTLVQHAVEDIANRMDQTLETLEAELPADFPQQLHMSISGGIQQRMRVLRTGLRAP